MIINITSYWFITCLKFFRFNEVDSNEVAISTEKYELTGREVSSLLGDEAQGNGSRWISTAVITYSFCILDPLFIAYLRHEFYNSTLFTKQVWHAGGGHFQGCPYAKTHQKRPPSTVHKLHNKHTWWSKITKFQPWQILVHTFTLCMMSIQRALLSK